MYAALDALSCRLFPLCPVPVRRLPVRYPTCPPFRVASIVLPSRWRLPENAVVLPRAAVSGARLDGNPGKLRDYLYDW